MCQPGKLFEQEVKVLAELMGHVIERPPQPSTDGGVDMITRLRNMPFGWGTYVIQCKDSPNASLGRPIVDQLIGTLERENVPMGIIITTGQFNKKAIKAANHSGRVQLINGAEWRTMRKRLTAIVHIALAVNGKSSKAFL